MLQVGLIFLLKIPIVDLKLAQSLANSVIFTLSASDGARRRAARFDASMYTGHSPGPHCHSTLALAAIGCHHGGICTRVVAPLLPFPAKMTVLSPVGGRTGQPDASDGGERLVEDGEAGPARAIPTPRECYLGPENISDRGSR